MKSKQHVRLGAVALAFLAMLASGARADVKCASMFSDHMVLQRGTAVPVWGWADVGEAVTITLAGQTRTTQAGADGKWMVKLDALKAGEPLEMTVSGKNTIRFTDILVGEVWVCSGQSNMQWPLVAASDGAKEVSAANHPQIRLFAVTQAIETRPADAVRGRINAATKKEVSPRWQLCTPQSAGQFSAVGYFFGRQLQKDLNVPIGLIGSYWGGTPAEAWTDVQTLQADPDYKSILNRGAAYPSQYPKFLAQYEAALEKWKEADEKAKVEKIPSPKAPPKPEEPGKYSKLPAVLFNGMISPLAPYAIKGAIWYQGEDNTSRAYQYRKLLPDMIKSWRTAWGQGDFYFCIVQLANFRQRELIPSVSSWAELREAQALTAKNVPNCGMAVTIDIGEAASIHPKNKLDVGLRLGLQAEKHVYEKSVVDSGPVYQSMSVEDGKARIKFTSIGGGLVCKGERLDGFVIAGPDKNFVLADTKIDGNDVVVSSELVKDPVAVRYGWAENPPTTLFNKEGLPAGPFRSDDWPGKTVNAK